MAYRFPILLYAAFLALFAQPKRTPRIWPEDVLLRTKVLHPPQPACHRVRKHPPVAGRSSIDRPPWRGRSREETP